MKRYDEHYTTEPKPGSEAWHRKQDAADLRYAKGVLCLIILSTVCFLGILWATH